MAVTKSTLYITLLLTMIVVAVDVWYVTNVLEARAVSFLLWEGGVTIVLLLIAALLSFVYIPKNGNGRSGILLVLSFLIFEVLIMLNYATMTTFIEKLSYYFHMALTSAVIIIIGMIGNIVGLEKQKEDGFTIWIHDKDSPIPTKMIAPVWLAIFFAMGGLVSVMGSVFVQYPSFGVLPWLGGPAISGFGVGDWENIIYMIFPFAITYGLATWKNALPKFAAGVIALIISITSFGVYHFLAYSTNMIAMMVVLIFGAVSILSYYLTKSMIPMSAIHIGNNFWGALFRANIIGFSAFGMTTAASNLMLSAVLIIVMGAIIFAIIKKYGVKK